MVKSQLKTAKQDDRPSTEDIQAQLADLASQFKAGIVDQHAQIFQLANDGEGQDNSQFKWLTGGTQLALTLSQNDLKENMKTSMV